MHVHEDIGAKRKAAILICAGWVLDRRHVGKNLSVHIRRPAASSYWKSNWSDTCIFELNEPGFSIHSFWVGVTLACKLGTETKKIGHVIKALRNRGCPHTQRPYVAKIYHPLLAATVILKKLFQRTSKGFHGESLRNESRRHYEKEPT